MFILFVLCLDEIVWFVYVGFCVEGKGVMIV